jgi:hypothetical protein
MNNRILHVAEVLKKEKWSLIIMFIGYFSLFYLSGHFLKIMASDWIWTKDFEEMYPNSPDFERITSIVKMILRGNIIKAYETLWLFSPILFSLLCTLGAIRLNYAVNEKNKQGKKHIAEYIMVGLVGALVAIFIFNKLFVWS